MNTTSHCYLYRILITLTCPLEAVFHRAIEEVLGLRDV
jgi:hypothetical protein